MSSANAPRGGTRLTLNFSADAEQETNFFQATAVAGPKILNEHTPAPKSPVSSAISTSQQVSKLPRNVAPSPAAGGASNTSLLKLLQPSPVQKYLFQQQQQVQQESGSHASLPTATSLVQAASATDSLTPTAERASTKEHTRAASSSTLDNVSTGSSSSSFLKSPTSYDDMKSPRRQSRSPNNIYVGMDTSSGGSNSKLSVPGKSTGVVSSKPVISPRPQSAKTRDARQSIGEDAALSSQLRPVSAPSGLHSHKASVISTGSAESLSAIQFGDDDGAPEPDDDGDGLSNELALSDAASPLTSPAISRRSSLVQGPHQASTSSLASPASRPTSASSSRGNIRVVVRVRPLSIREKGQSDRNIVFVEPAAQAATHGADKGSETPEASSKSGSDLLHLVVPNVLANAAGNNVKKELDFAFDAVLDKNSSQRETYEQTAGAADVVSAVLEGINSTVFAYGATGSGKTYTIQGTEDDPGVMIQTISALFEKLHSRSDSNRFRLTVSYLEIYNETLRDLLCEFPAAQQPPPEDFDNRPGTAERKPVSAITAVVMGDGNVTLREDSKQGSVLSGCSEYEIGTEKQLWSLIAHGSTRRTVDSHLINEASSRSHAILQLSVTNCDTGVASKLSLVDLAGSERANQTGTSGKMLREGANINKSLLALANCINALASKTRKGLFVPFRDSKLTRLLKESLSDAQSRTVMIANISCASSQFDETRETLVYANRTKQIKARARDHKKAGFSVAEYQNIINDLRSELSDLKSVLLQERMSRALDTAIPAPIASSSMPISDSSSGPIVQSALVSPQSSVGLSQKVDVTAANGELLPSDMSGSECGPIVARIPESPRDGHSPRNVATAQEPFAIHPSHEDRLAANALKESASKEKHDRASALAKTLAAVTSDWHSLTELRKQIRDNFSQQIETKKMLFEINSTNKNNFLKINAVKHLCSEWETQRGPLSRFFPETESGTSLGQPEQQSPFAPPSPLQSTYSNEALLKDVFSPIGGKPPRLSVPTIDTASSLGSSVPATPHYMPSFEERSTADPIGSVQVSGASGQAADDDSMSDSFVEAVRLECLAPSSVAQSDERSSFQQKIQQATAYGQSLRASIDDNMQLKSILEMRLEKLQAEGSRLLGRSFDCIRRIFHIVDSDRATADGAATSNSVPATTIPSAREQLSLLMKSTETASQTPQSELPFIVHMLAQSFSMELANMELELQSSLLCSIVEEQQQQLADKKVSQVSLGIIRNEAAASVPQRMRTFSVSFQAQEEYQRTRRRSSDVVNASSNGFLPTVLERDDLASQGIQSSISDAPNDTIRVGSPIDAAQRDSLIFDFFTSLTSGTMLEGVPEEAASDVGVDGDPVSAVQLLDDAHRDLHPGACVSDAKQVCNPSSIWTALWPRMLSWPFWFAIHRVGYRNVFRPSYWRSQNASIVSTQLPLAVGSVRTTFWLQVFATCLFLCLFLPSTSGHLCLLVVVVNLILWCRKHCVSTDFSAPALLLLVLWHRNRPAARLQMPLTSEKQEFAELEDTETT